MRCNSESLEIWVVIGGTALLFKDIKISLGLLITARKMPALIRENRYLKVSTIANKYVLLAGWEVRIGKNCDRGLKAVNNIFIFFFLP